MRLRGCKCLEPIGLRAGMPEWLDELREFREEPSMDELSDITFGIGRLVAGLFGKVYVRMPFDRMHIEKAMKRMNEYGCVRSKRHLTNGMCPSA